MDLKVLSAIVSSAVGAVAFITYLKSVFSRKTQPHLYTWLIWTITQGTATVGLLYGGGGFGAAGLIVGTMFVGVVFLFSLRYGSKNITKEDTVVLVLALFAVVIWWQLRQPTLAVLMVSGIDVFGYIPSWRKSFEEPWSEPVLTWAGFALSNVFAVLALREYNLLTMSYLISIAAADIVLIFICLARRPIVAQPTRMG